MSGARASGPAALRIASFTFARTFARIAALSSAALMAGCFNPQPVPGAACSASGACPSGLECIHGQCLVPGTAVPDGSSPDAPVDASVALDAAIDARPDAFVDTGLVAHWELDDDPLIGGALDSSGRGHTAMCVGACPKMVTGRIGGGYLFDASEDHALVVADHPDFRGTFTIAAWVYAEPGGRRGAAMSKAYGNASSNSWQLELRDDTGRLSFSGGTSHYLEDAATMTTGTWYHVAGSWDGATKRLYVNGALVATEASDIRYDGHPIVLGADENNGSPALHWDGVLDDLRVYGRVLSPAEIQDLAAN